MRDALPPTPAEPARTGFVCPVCNRQIITGVAGLFHHPAHGSRQRFCSPACRQAAYRRRQANADETSPLQHHGGRGRSLTNPNPEGVHFQPSPGGPDSPAVDTVTSTRISVVMVLLLLSFEMGERCRLVAVRPMRTSAL